MHDCLKYISVFTCAVHTYYTRIIPVVCECTQSGGVARRVSSENALNVYLARNFFNHVGTRIHTHTHVDCENSNLKIARVVYALCENEESARARAELLQFQQNLNMFARKLIGQKTRSAR